MLYIRPDRFNSIDERLGPVASDALLKVFGLLVAQKVGKQGVVARFGGNIFTVLVVRHKLSEICSVAEDLVDTISNMVFAAGQQSTSMTASIGLVELTHSVRDSNHALSLAQAAAGEARRKGGSQFELNQSLEIDHDGKLQDAGWLRKIQAAFKNDTFQLVFQPIASLTGGASNSYDVLVRMLDDQQGNILPDDFLPTAERNGLMPAIDRWVIEHALALSVKRAAKGKPTLLFLRVSEASLVDDSFTDWLTERCHRYQLPAGSVVLQISESVAERYLSRVRALKTLCLKLRLLLSMANAGAGDNCQQLIRLIPMDFLAIDGGFIEDLGSPHRRAQVDQIIAAAREKEIPTIATRVENASELAVLCNMGVDYVVGYHVQEPDEIIVEDVLLPMLSSMEGSRRSSSL